MECDYRNVKKIYPTGSFDSVVVNPPYREIGTGRMNHCKGVASASYELNVTLEDIFHTAQYLLKYGGRLTMIHRADRLVDLITLGRRYKMEAKRIRPVYARIGASAVRVLLEFRYGGHTELILEPPLLIHNTDGSYTQEIMEIYGKKTNE